MGQEGLYLQARRGFKLSLHPHVQFHEVSTET